MDPKVRAAELQRLRKDPPKQPTLQRSATGFNGVRYYCVKKLLESYTLPSKHDDHCSLTREEMIESILRHEATLGSKGNWDHDTWRTSREGELILVPLYGEQLSLRALMSQYHRRFTKGTSREEAVAAILCYECPETLRQAGFQTFWRDHQRLPTSGCQCRTENAYAAYLDCSLHRRYAAYRGKAALTDDEIRSWDVIFLRCGGTPSPWQDNPELQAIAVFQKEHGRFPQLNTGKTEFQRAENQLASMLCIISRARDGDVQIHHRDGTTSIRRPRLSTTEILRWEAVLGAGLWRQAVQQE
jgi:hypothetical protein